MVGRIHIPIKVFTENKSIGEVYEYCVFSHIYRDKMQGHKGRRKAIVRATLRGALEREVLRDFLDDHMEEVKKIMSETNEYYFSKYVEGVTKDAEKRGELRGEKRGENKEKMASLNKNEALMKKRGVPETEIKEFLNEYSMICNQCASHVKAPYDFHRVFFLVLSLSPNNVDMKRIQVSLKEGREYNSCEETYDSVERSLF